MTAPDVIRLGAHQHLTVLESSSDRLVLEARWDAEAGDPPAHLHPTQCEDFTVLEGRLRVTLDGATRAYGTGESFTVPPGVVHAMTSDGVATRARWEVTPAQATEAMFRALAAADGRGRLAAVRVVARHRAEIRLASPPDAVQRVLFGLVRRLP